MSGGVRSLGNKMMQGEREKRGGGGYEKGREIVYKHYILFRNKKNVIVNKQKS